MINSGNRNIAAGCGKRSGSSTQDDAPARNEAPSASSYEANAVRTLEEFAGFVEARPADVLLTLSFGDLAAEARFAVERSAAALGFGDERVGYARMIGADGRGLEPKLLWRLVEGLDPLGVVATDAPTAELLSQAYHQPISLEARSVIFGRPVVAFGDLAGLLADGAGKQRAWALLKTLKIS